MGLLAVMNGIDQRVLGRPGGMSARRWRRWARLWWLGPAIVLVAGGLTYLFIGSFTPATWIGAFGSSLFGSGFMRAEHERLNRKPSMLSYRRPYELDPPAV